jgi:hypothetical protein
VGAPLVEPTGVPSGSVTVDRPVRKEADEDRRRRGRGAFGRLGGNETACENGNCSNPEEPPHFTEGTTLSTK